MTVAAEIESWQTRRQAAAELSTILGGDITANVLDGWARDPTCPIPDGRNPIPKAPLILWAQTNKRRVGGKGERGSDPDDFPTLEREKLIEEIRKLRGVNARIYDESINAEDARQGVVRAVEDLRRELTQELPSALWALCQGKAAEEATALIRDALTAALNRFHEAAKELAP